MRQSLFGCASSNYSFRTNLKPTFFISLKRLHHSTLFIKKFYYAFIVPHKPPIHTSLCKHAIVKDIRLTFRFGRSERTKLQFVALWLQSFAAKPITSKNMCVIMFFFTLAAKSYHSRTLLFVVDLD